MDAKDDTEANIDIEGQIMCNETNPIVKRSKFISSTFPCGKDKPSNTYKNRPN